MKPLLICLLGPTASGKTAWSIRIAERLGTTVLSADARQFYREMSIGTAKPTPEELAQAPHLFIDSLSIRDEYTAASFAFDALSALDRLYAEKQVAVLCGGSTLYTRALLHGLDPMPPEAPEIRQELQKILSEQGIAPLQEFLREKDPAQFAVMDLNNPQRLIRALEVCLATGQPYSSFRSGGKTERPFRTLKIGLDLPRKELYARIEARCDAMIEAGLLEEVKALYPNRQLPALQTVGYTEFWSWVEDRANLEDCIALFKQHTRNYAKRQMTWFRKEEDIRWFHPEDEKGIWMAVESQI